MKRIGLIFIMLLMPINANAKWVNGGMIMNIIPDGTKGGHGIVVEFDSVISVPGNTPCTTKYHYIDASTESGKNLEIKEIKGVRVN